MNNTPIPAPWKLKGYGYVLLYRFDKNHVIKSAFIPQNMKGNFKGGFGAIMVVNYQDSDAGPYDELLYIPGKFQNAGRVKHNIPKIYVSTMESVTNGIRNWAIPKEQADFNFQKVTKQETIAIQKNGESILSMETKWGGLPFPVNTRFLPFPLLQDAGDHWLETNFSGKGWGKLCKIESLKINPRFFPDVSAYKPLMCIRVEPFNIEFPQAIKRSKNEN